MFKNSSDAHFGHGWYVQLRTCATLFYLLVSMQTDH